jgi:hypothetical protein
MDFLSLIVVLGSGSSIYSDLTTSMTVFRLCVIEVDTRVLLLG